MGLRFPYQYPALGGRTLSVSIGTTRVIRHLSPAFGTSVQRKLTRELNPSRWHVFTAFGGYIAVVVVDMITSDEVDVDSMERLAWPLCVVARFTAPSPGPKKQA